MQRDRFNSGRYCNWVKGSLSLCYLKEGVTDFSNDKAAAFHRDIIQRVSLRRPNVASAKCGSCTHKQAVKTKTKDKKATTWRMSCRLNICSVWLEEILPYHRHQPCPDIAWKNSDPQLWPSDCWEVAKIFQPYGCQQQRRAEDCDAAGLLTMIQDCSFFSKFISNPAIIQDIKTARNACMHSNDLEMSDTEMQQSLNLMVAFLEEPELQKHQTARDAVVKIKQLRDNILDLSLNKELELKALHKKMAEMEQNVTSVQGITQNLRNDINIRTDRLREDISDLRLTSQKHQATITTLQGDIDTHTDQLGGHELQLQSHQGDIDTHKATLGGHELRLQSHQCDIDTHKATLGGHELRLQSHQGDIDTHKATLGGHELRLQTHQGDIDTHKATLGGHELRLQSHQGDIDTHTAKLGGHELRLQTHQGDIDTHKATLGGHELRLQSNQGNIDTHKAKLGGHELRLQTHQGDIDTHKATLGGHELRLQSHQGDIDTHKATLGGHELWLQSHQGDIDTHKAKLGGHELRLDSQHRTLEFHEAKLDTLDRQQHLLQQQHPGRGFNVEDLRATLIGLYREQLQCILPIYLIEPDWKHPVEDLFVKQSLQRIDPRGKPKYPDNPHGGNPDQTKPTKDGDKNIDNLTDIFFKDGNVCKDVYISSEAGYGKTSLCAHLVRLWCEAHLKSDVDLASTDPDLAKDLQSMKTFSLLFYINLREADIPEINPKSDEISLLVHKQLELSDQKCSISDIKSCLSNPSTLVLMDSLDEMRSTRLPNRGLHNKSCIVTTSRPWKIEALRSQLHSKIGYQQIEIVGLTKTSPKDLVKNVLKILNKEYDQEKNGGEFLRAIKKAGLQDFLTIPVLILQMLSLWFDGESFGRSQSEIYSNVVHHQILTAIKTEKVSLYEGENQQKFPFSCTSDPTCEAYGDLLWKVSRLAFHTLFGEDREMCLVFYHKVTSFYELSGDEVEICLKIGILTQHKLFVKKLSEKKKSVSFLHKTNQEYFAAVYLSYRWQESVKKQIFSVISDLDRAMELDKVLLFCSQLNPEVARELSGLIYEIADRDTRVHEYRQSGDYAGTYDSAPNKDLIHKIQNIISATVQQSGSVQVSPTLEPQTSSSASAHTGMLPNTRHTPSSSKRKGIIGKIKYFLVPSSKENRSRSKSTSTQESPSQQPAVASTPSTQDRSRSTPKLILADIILEEPQWLRTVEDRTVNVEALDMAAVKSVHIDALWADVTIWKHLERARCLETFVLRNGQKTKSENLHGVVVRNQATLRTLSLHANYSLLGMSLLDLTPLGNKLADMLTCDLTCLLLRCVKLSHKQCEMLCRHLSISQNLRRLTLLLKTFSHEQCDILCRHLSTTQNLRQLTLGYIECQTHGGGRFNVEAGCCDVKLHSKLELLKLECLPFNRVSFPAEVLKTCEIKLRNNVPAATSAISCLTSASNLREFTCVSLLDVASVRELATVLPRLHGLQRIDLSDIDFGCLRETRLSVAAAKTLESVRLGRSAITAYGLESLVQSVDAPRVKIELYDVTIRDGERREFLQRLRDSPEVKVKKDRGVKYEDATRWRVAGWKVEKFEFYKNKQQTS